MPFEYDGNFGVGTEGNTQSVFLFKPVAPVSLGDDYNL
jgi:hypothetical protein